MTTGPQLRVEIQFFTVQFTTVRLDSIKMYLTFTLLVLERAASAACDLLLDEAEESDSVNKELEEIANE